MRLLLAGMVLVLFLFGCKTEVTGNVIAETCTETDAGLDKLNVGTTSTEDVDKTDRCIAGLLVEYYCEDGKITNQNIRCEGSCSVGKCV
ncbi:MAG TPA: hypothetical protein VJH97_05270 [Candidatus Nanoarchaeia archaeon]|nr:hypothetical protein [Candidatus Nanoarchaeia archaeon]